MTGGAVVPAGIVFTASTDASAASAFKSMQAHYDALKSKGDSQHNTSLKQIASSLKLGAALRTLGAAVRVAERAYAATIGASIELRSETDHNRRVWDGLGKSIDESSAKIGDMFLPAALALKSAFSDTLKSITGTKTAADELTQVAIADWAINAGKALVTGLAFGATAANMAINGLAMAGNVGSGLWNRYSLALAKVGVALGGTDEGLTEMQRAVDDSDSAAAHSMSRMKEWERQIVAVTKSMKTGLTDARKAAQDAAKHTGGRVVGDKSAQDAATKRAAEIEREEIESNDRQFELRKTLRANRERIAKEEAQTEKELREKSDQEEEDSNNLQYDLRKTLKRNREQLAEEEAKKEKERIDDMKASFRSGFGTVFSGMKTLVGDLVEGTKDAGEAFGDFAKGIGEALLDAIAEEAAARVAAALFAATVDTAVKSEQVATAAAVGGANAAASAAETPIIGPLIAIPIGLALAAAIASSFAIAANKGAIVPSLPGSQRGVDSVPAMLAPKEMVLPADLSEMFQAMGATFRANKSGGGSGGGGGGRVVIEKLELKASSIERPSPEHLDRVAEQIVPAIVRVMQRKGLM